MKRLWNFIKRFVKARYEAAYQMWGERSWLAAAVQDARFDADASTRLELVRRARYWERNNGIVQKLAGLFEQFTIGSTGLKIIPDSSSDEWNRAAADWWEQWCSECDLTSTQSFGCLQGLMARTWFIQGEVFIYKTQEGRRPRIQLLEGHKVCTPPDKKKDEGTSVIDGIQFSQPGELGLAGKPRAYYVLASQKGIAPPFAMPTFSSPNEEWITIPAEQLLHLYEPHRPGLFRGLPYLYSVMNDLHDLDDLQMLEMKAAKAAAEITNVITTASGEVDPAELRRQVMKIQSQDQSGNSVTKQPDLYYQVTLGGRTLALKKGEDIKQFQSNRPSVATQEYWDYLTAKVSAGTGIPRLLIFPYTLQGTVTRADLDVASTCFRARSYKIALICRQIYLWALGWARKYESRQLFDGAAAPADWDKVRIRPPRAVNVDVGRNSNAMIAEWQAGLRTAQDVYGECGDDWQRAIEQRAEEAAFIQKMAKQYGVDPGDIARPNPTAPAKAPDKEENLEAETVKT